MMIQLTFAQTKKVFCIRADMVMVVERTNDNILVTNVMTNLMTQKGPLIYQVLEQPETVRELVNDAVRGLGGSGAGSLIKSH